MKYLSFSLIFCFSLLSLAVNAQDDEYGLASYYSDGFQGRSTAYGDTYDKDELTCAHKRYAYGTTLRVTRLDNNRSVNVKVIDKGPFIKGRVVDLSRRAAEVLGIIDMGPVEVKVERLSGSTATAAPEPAVVRSTPQPEPIPQEMDEPAPARITTTDVGEQPATRQASEETTERTAATAAKVERAEPEEARPQAVNTTVEPAKTRFSPVGEDFSPYGLYRITLEKPDEQAGFGVQVASLSNYENVLKQVAALQAKWFENVLVSIEPGEGGANSYKVILGPFEDTRSAQRYQQDLASRYKIRGFVVNLAELSY